MIRNWGIDIKTFDHIAYEYIDQGISTPHHITMMRVFCCLAKIDPNQIKELIKNEELAENTKYFIEQIKIRCDWWEGVAILSCSNNPTLTFQEVGEILKSCEGSPLIQGIRDDIETLIATPGFGKEIDI